MKKMLLTQIGSALLVTAAAASAHDTWFEPVTGPAAGRGVRVLALGTGTEYPLQETAIGAEYLARQGCLLAGKADGAATAMQPLRNTPTVSA